MYIPLSQFIIAIQYDILAAAGMNASRLIELHRKKWKRTEGVGFYIAFNSLGLNYWDLL